MKQRSGQLACGKELRSSYEVGFLLLLPLQPETQESGLEVLCDSIESLFVRGGRFTAGAGSEILRASPSQVVEGDTPKKIAFEPTQSWKAPFLASTCNPRWFAAPNNRDIVSGRSGWFMRSDGRRSIGRPASVARLMPVIAKARRDPRLEELEQIDRPAHTRP